MTNPSRTVFITGASSGIGLAAARYFHQQGWKVAATMRHPENRRTPLHDLGLSNLFHLDVTDEESIRAAVDQAVKEFQHIDVLINNAGYAVYGPFETTSKEQIKREYDTNVFGLMAVTRAFLPVFRDQKDGTVINIASMGGRTGFPLYSVYNSTKWAVEGFTEALMYELKPHNIKVRLIEPGVIKTDFYDRSLDRADSSKLKEFYADIIERGKKSLGEYTDLKGIDPEIVAREIYKAAVDQGGRLRYTVGADAKQASFMRWFLPEGLFFRLLEQITLFPPKK